MGYDILNNDGGIQQHGVCKVGHLEQLDKVEQHDLQNPPNRVRMV
jgi:hypothetical protein